MYSLECEKRSQKWETSGHSWSTWVSFSHMMIQLYKRLTHVVEPLELKTQLTSSTCNTKFIQEVFS